MKTLFCTTALSVFALAAFAQEETSIPMDQVPAVVAEAAMANAMGVTFDNIQLDDGVYEFSGAMTNGMMLEVDVIEDGSIEEIEEQIAADMLPPAVAAALVANFEGFEPTFIEKSTRADAVVYEFEGMFDGAEIDAEISEDGMTVTSNLDAAG